ncbi:MerR family DNA-binding transcriptional regulator [Duodenibacillus massiliensis]|uniref:MerR family DNA-binding transcriptional regulator n=1 Tax=Duodenibacillus massiliensis TaxID=1852381 RepID=UPI003C6CF632
MTLVSIGLVAKQYDVSVSTIRRRVAKGLLSCSRTFGGHRRFVQNDDADIPAILRTKTYGARHGKENPCCRSGGCVSRGGSRCGVHRCF